MSNTIDRIRKFQLHFWMRDNQIVPAMEVFTIANTVTLLGLLVYQIVDPFQLLDYYQSGIDINVISIGYIWLLILRTSIGATLIIFSWVIAGIYAKQRYGKDSPAILLKGSAIPIIFIFMTYGLIEMVVVFDTGNLGNLIQPIYLLGIGLIISGLLTFFGLIISLFVAFKSSYPMSFSIEPDYLVLPVIPEDEKVEYCPFRSKEPGCSYLGYIAPDKPLICDYRSAYLRCRVYSHIYDKLEAQKDE